MTSSWDTMGVKVEREHVERGGLAFTRFTCVIERAPAEEPQHSQTVTQRGEVELILFNRTKAPPVVGFEVEFTAETRWTRLTKFLTDELQTNDAAFDDDVYIEIVPRLEGETTPTQHRDVAAQLLGSTQLREALQEFVKTGRVVLHHGKVVVELEGRHTDDPPALRRLMAAYVVFVRP